MVTGERMAVVVTLGCYKLSKPDGIPENLSEIVTLGLQFILCRYDIVLFLLGACIRLAVLYTAEIMLSGIRWDRIRNSRVNQQTNST